MHTGPGGAREYALESTGNRFFGERAVPISEEAFGILLSADGVRTLGEFLAEREITGAEGVRQVVDEMVDLWSRRVVILRPQAWRDAPASGQQGSWLPVPVPA
jgi:hypothetical protein